MKKALLLIVILCAGIFSVHAQKKEKKVYKSDSIQTVELLSVYDQDSRFVGQNSDKGCLNLLTAARTCDPGTRWSILKYGRMRVGNEWDWLDIAGMSRDSQTRMVGLGKKNWEDAMELPVIKPWRKLKPGEERTVTVSANGRDGQDGEDGRPGANGMNGAGANTLGVPVNNPEASWPDPSKTKTAQSGGISTTTTKTGYNPFLKAVQGNMYLVRVLDDVDDYYLLFRVDELVRGTKCVISWRKLDIPAEERSPKY